MPTLCFIRENTRGKQRETLELQSAETFPPAPSFQGFNKLLKLPGCRERTVQSQESSYYDDDDASLRATNQKRSNDGVFGPGRQWAQPSAPGHQSDTLSSPRSSLLGLWVREDSCVPWSSLHFWSPPSICTHITTLVQNDSSLLLQKKK